MNFPHVALQTILGMALASALVYAPAVAVAVSVSNLSDGSLSGNTLTVTADVSGVAANATATLWLGQAAPKDGDPAALLQETNQSISFTGDGTATFTPHVVLGTKVAFKVVVTEGGDSAESGVKTMTINDNTEYYCSNKTGVWSDPTIWDKGTDNGNRLGYPSYGSKFIFSGGTCNIQVDAEYTGLQGKSFGWNGVTVTLTGSVEGAALTGDFGLECYQSALTLDAVRVEVAAYTVTANSSLSLCNGAYLSTRWWLTVGGENASLYVGSGSEIVTSTDSGWWYGIILGGKNAEIVIENGTIRTPRFWIGATWYNAQSYELGYDNNTPKGIRFLGTSPKFLNGSDFLIVNPNLGGSPVVEFVVPAGGYRTAPLGRNNTNSDNPLGGHYFLDHGSARLTALPPILFKVSAFSPFFSGSLVDNVLLVDWSYDGNSSAGINTDATDCGIDYVAFEDPENNSFYTDSNVDGVSATRVWAHLTGTGEPASKTLVNSTVSGSVSGSALTVNASLLDYDGGNGTSSATLYVGYAGPAGDPTINMTAAATTPLATGNDFTISADVVLGSKTAYAVIVENTQGQWHYTSSTATNIVQVGDPNVEYRWVDNTDGLWSNPANWICSTDDGKTRIGYPSYQNRARWSGNQTAVVHVDGAYTGLADCFWDNPGLNLTLVGDVDGAAVGMSNVRCTSNTDVTFDHVAYSSGSVSAGSGGSLVLTNGATVTSAWEINVNGTDAYMYVGPGCTATVSPNGDWAFRIDGNGARVVIDNGSIIANRVYFGEQRADETPAGIEFRGVAPLLSVLKRFRLENAIPGSPVFTFLVPEGGYASAPIQRRGGDYLFLEQKSSETPVCVFQVDRHSPFFNESKAVDVPLVAWDNASGINTSGIAFSQADPSCRFFYTPEDAATKTGLWVHAQGHGYTLLMIY